MILIGLFLLLALLLLLLGLAFSFIFCGSFAAIVYVFWLAGFAFRAGSGRGAGTTGKTSYAKLPISRALFFGNTH